MCADVSDLQCRESGWHSSSLCAPELHQPWSRSAQGVCCRRQTFLRRETLAQELSLRSLRSVCTGTKKLFVFPSCPPVPFLPVLPFLLFSSNVLSISSPYFQHFVLSFSSVSFPFRLLYYLPISLRSFPALHFLFCTFWFLYFPVMFCSAVSYSVLCYAPLFFFAPFVPCIHSNFSLPLDRKTIFFNSHQVSKPESSSDLTAVSGITSVNKLKTQSTSRWHCHSNLLCFNPQCKIMSYIYFLNSFQWIQEWNTVLF